MVVGEVELDLVALADAARADAALAAAVIAADPTVAARIDPLRAARTEHAAALDAEIVRVGGVPSTATPSTAPAVGTAGPAAPDRRRTLPLGARVRATPRSAVTRYARGRSFFGSRIESGSTLAAAVPSPTATSMLPRSLVSAPAPDGLAAVLLGEPVP